jgi:DNA-binding response OmpR family regulator
MTSDVAIVSPREEIRLLLRGLLKLHHFRVLQEGTTPHSLSEIAGGEASIVLLDAELDAEEGWADALRRLREQRPNLRVVLLTSSRSVRAGSQALAAGVSAVVHRPFAVHELIEAVRGEAGGAAASGPAPGHSSGAAPV